MIPESMQFGRWGLMAVLLLVATASSAKAQSDPEHRLRIGAGTGGYVPRSSVIKTSDGSDTRFVAGPSFSLDLEYLTIKSVSVFLSATGAFPSIRSGSSLRPDVQGPSTQVTLLGGTIGALAEIPVLGAHFRPTVRVGGGFKYYGFDLTGAKSHARFTGDFGIGFRGLGNGPLDVAAEVRFLPSAFDQSNLPTRGIVPQKQRQNDWVFGIGIGIRP